MASTLANAFDLLGAEQANEASAIVAVKTAEAEEHKKIVAQQKKIAAEQKKEKKIAAEAEKKKAEADNNKKITSGHGNAPVHGQRFINIGHRQRNGQPTMVLSEEERWLAGREQWLARREQWLAREAQREAEREQWLAREEERKKDRALKTLKEYEEQKALEKQQKANKSTCLSTLPESTPLREAAGIQDDFQTKQKSKNGPAARGRGTQDSRKNMNNGNYKAGYSKRNQDNPLPHEDKTVKVKPKPAAAPDLSETNFPVLGKVTEPTKFSVKHGTKDNNTH